MILYSVQLKMCQKYCNLRLVHLCPCVHENAGKGTIELSIKALWNRMLYSLDFPSPRLSFYYLYLELRQVSLLSFFSYERWATLTGFPLARPHTFTMTDDLQIFLSLVEHSIYFTLTTSVHVFILHLALFCVAPPFLWRDEKMGHM